MKNSASSFSITPRDIDILNFVFSVDGCSIDHIIRRFFPSSHSFLPYGPKTSAYNRVRKLVEANYLRQKRLDPITSAGMGSGKRLLTIGPAAYDLLSHQLGLPRSKLHKARQELSSIPAYHHFGIVDFLISLQLALTLDHSVSLEEWTSERQLRASPIKVTDPNDASGRARIVLVPDGAFSLAIAPGVSQPFHLEMDMGTVAPKRMREKLRGYLCHFKSLAAAILWVVSDLKRAKLIEFWALEQATSLGADPTIFWIATRGSLSEQTILSPIWQVAGIDQPMALVPHTQPANLSHPAQLMGTVYFSATS